MKCFFSFLLIFICRVAVVGQTLSEEHAYANGNNNTVKEKPILDTGQCIKVSKRNHFACGDPADLVVKIENICTQGPLDGKVFIERLDGSWYSGYFSNLVLKEAKEEHWTCYSTGKVIIYRTKHGTAGEADYPTAQEIQEKFGSKKISRLAD